MSKITIDQEAIKMALEALQAPVETVNTRAMKAKASAALREALAQPQREPVATLKDTVLGCFGAAFAEGLQEVLEETQDARLRDLVERRLMHALYAAQDTSPPAQPQPVAHPFANESVISALSWAASLIENGYRECGGHNGADSWLMNYADKQGERIRQADHREWEKVNGKWQAKAIPPHTARKPLTDEEKLKIAKDVGVKVRTGAAAIKFANAIEAAHGIK